MSFQNRNLQIDEARSLTKPVIGRGENPGHLENRPKSVLDFGEFWGSTRYRSKSVEGRPVLVGFRQLTELEPRLAGCVVLECGIGLQVGVKYLSSYLRWVVSVSRGVHECGNKARVPLVTLHAVYRSWPRSKRPQPPTFQSIQEER